MTMSAPVTNHLSEARTSRIGRAAPACAAVLVVCVCAACGDEPIEPPDNPVEVAAGTAQADGTGFVEVEDGTDAELHPGAQGGFHVWLTTSVRGISGELYIERNARRVSDDALVFRGLPQVIEIPEEAVDEPWHEERAAPAFMCPAPVGLQVFDEPLRFEVTLLSDFDEDGVVLGSDAVIMVPRCPTDGQNAFCLEICAG